MAVFETSTILVLVALSVGFSEPRSLAQHKQMHREDKEYVQSLRQSQIQPMLERVNALADKEGNQLQYDFDTPYSQKLHRLFTISDRRKRSVRSHGNLRRQHYAMADDKERVTNLFHRVQRSLHELKMRAPTLYRQIDLPPKIGREAFLPPKIGRDVSLWTEMDVDKNFQKNIYKGYVFPFEGKKEKLYSMKVNQKKQMPPKFGKEIQFPPKIGREIQFPPKIGKEIQLPPKIGRAIYYIPMTVKEKQIKNPVRMVKEAIFPPKMGKEVQSPPNIGKEIQFPPKIGRNLALNPHFYQKVSAFKKFHKRSPLLSRSSFVELKDVFPNDSFKYWSEKFGENDDLVSPKVVKEVLTFGGKMFNSHYRRRGIMPPKVG